MALVLIFLCVVPVVVVVVAVVSFKMLKDHFEYNWNKDYMESAECVVWLFVVDLSVVPCLSGKSCGPGRSFEASRRARAGKDLCFLRMRPALYRLSLVYCCAKEGKAKLDVLFFPASTTRKHTFRGSGTDMGEEDGTSSRFSC